MFTLGEMVKKQTPDKFVFYGTLIDGPGIDLLELAGLDLSDEDHDRLWNDLSPRALLAECECVEEFEEGDDDGFPSDVWYSYEATSKERLSDELRTVILERLRTPQRAIQPKRTPR